MDNKFNFNLQNLTNTIKEYNSSKFFEENVLLKEYYPYQYNSWSGHRRYGVINTKNITIYPKDESLKSYTTSNGIRHENINFVTDAFLDLKKSMDSLYTKTVVSEGASLYIKLNPINTYKNVTSMYSLYLNFLFDTFMNTYLTEEQKNNIIDINTFIPVFLEYIKIVTEKMPILRETYIKSNLTPEEVTGLVISLDDRIREDDFNNKTNKYIVDKYFNTFVEMAGRFGFYVNRNAPWKIVADLDSPIMRNYAQKYNYKNLEEIFDNCYHEAYKTDLLILKIILLNFWNGYCSKSKTIIKSNFMSGCGKLFTTAQNLNTIEENMFDISFNTDWMIRLYIYTKYLEQKPDINQNRFETIFKEACRISKYINLDKCMLYIAEKFNELPKKPSDAFLDLTEPTSLDKLISTNKFRVSNSDIKF